DLPPALTIAPGDTVRLRTLDAAWNIKPRLASPYEVPPEKFAPRIPERDSGHALCGPIAIRSAEPGMALGVRIDTIRPGTWGWTAAGGWESPLNKRLGVTEDEAYLL